uniref:Uncharacterized protein n=1 Tax=Glossina morsitans morsitans TaxID=37546 RepID=A0A1B0FJL9_GLOMM
MLCKCKKYALFVVMQAIAEWDAIALERIGMSCDLTQYADVAAVVMQECKNFNYQVRAVTVARYFKEQDIDGMYLHLTDC